MKPTPDRALIMAPAIVPGGNAFLEADNPAEAVLDMMAAVGGSEVGDAEGVLSSPGVDIGSVTILQSESVRVHGTQTSRCRNM